jgi:SAM-dependent methyltransferase
MESAEYATMFRVEETHWWYGALQQFIFQALEHALPDWRTKAILDAGCGTGTILKRLGNPDQNVGVDVATEAISLCQRRGLKNVRQADINALPFANDTFDAVICSSVIYHEWVPDVGVALRELHRVLRPKGVLLLNVPAFGFLHSAHDDVVMTARRFRRNEVLSSLRANGFTVDRLTYWTTLLFPLALLARTFGASKLGRDFPAEGKTQSPADRIFATIMSIELSLLKRISMPFGVALFAVARKSNVA